MERLIRIIENLDFENLEQERFTFEEIANAFKQGRVNLPPLRRIGGGGNCASVALIKAAIGTNGFSGVFKSIIIDRSKKRFLVDLIDTDDTVHHVSFKNHKYASTKSAFYLKGTDEKSKDIIEFANFCFAVMCEIKRKTFRWNKKYKRAVTDLNKGESTRYIHELLGFNKKKIKNISIHNLNSLEHLVVWNPPHAVYSSKGFYDEFFSGYGDIEPLERLKDIHGNESGDDNPIGAYQLK